MNESQKTGGKYRLVRIDVQKQFDHEDPVTGLYVDQFTGRYVSSDNDGLVKIWTKDK